MLNLLLCHWSSQLFDLRASSSTDVPVLLLSQPNVWFKASSIFVHLQSKFYKRLSYNEIIIGRFKNDNGTENWPKRENSILFFTHPFRDENVLFGDYPLNSHSLFP